MIKKIIGATLHNSSSVKRATKKFVLSFSLSSMIVVPATLGKLPIRNASVEMQRAALQSKKFQKQYANNALNHYNKIFLVDQHKKNLAKKQKEIVTKIISEDAECPNTVDSAAVAGQIVKIAREYGADPIHIACIVKKESHFTKKASYCGAKGYMQVTKVVTQDMYKRPEAYTASLKNITSKHRSDNELFKQMQHQPLLNLRLGTILYLSKLSEAKGNVREALKEYNSGRLKHAYAADIISDIKKYKKMLTA